MSHMSDEHERAIRTAAKQALRERMRAVRRVLPRSACSARSRAICERVVALPAFERAHAVLGYAAFGKEASPHQALLAAERAGKAVGFPRVIEGGALALHRHHEGAELIENAFGILEPPDSAPVLDDAAIELVLVPVLAVDERGQRVGYGQGYYDRLLPRLAHAYKVAVAYDFQLLCEIPDTPGDFAVDCVVTDRHVLIVEPRSPERTEP
jgi:5-formyltetrahydrofolate cyclo-ligase